MFTTQQFWSAQRRAAKLHCPS